MSNYDEQTTELIIDFLSLVQSWSYEQGYTYIDYQSVEEDINDITITYSLRTSLRKLGFKITKIQYFGERMKVYITDIPEQRMKEYRDIYNDWIGSIVEEFE